MHKLVVFLSLALLLPTVSFASTCPNLTRNLSFGSRGTDVTQLQTFLIEKGDLAAGNNTGYFGRTTEAAVKKFQCREMQICSGSAASNGHGAVGPRTKIAIAVNCKGRSDAIPDVKPPVTLGTPPSGPGSLVVPPPFAASTPTPSPTTPTCTPFAQQTQTISCPTGQTGSITQTRTSSCATNATMPTWGAWQTTNTQCEIRQEVSTVTNENMHNLLDGFRNMYAPTTLTVNGTKRMWLCGWKTDADPDNYWAGIQAGLPHDQIEGPDKIWYSDLVNGTWTSPVLALKATGRQICDPSVLDMSGGAGTNMFMYYTTVIMQYFGAEEIKHPWTGLAKSTDGGKTWTDTGVLIGQENGADGWGAWAASALRVGNEIWLYYNTGNQDMSVNATFRQKFALDGVTKIGPPEALQYGPNLALSPGTSATLLANLSVHKDGDRYIMLAGTYDILNIVRLVSYDGITWDQLEKNHPILIHSSGPRIATPFLEITGPTSYSVYFGNAPEGSPDVKHIFRWDFTIAP